MSNVVYLSGRVSLQSFYFHAWICISLFALRFHEKMMNIVPVESGTRFFTVSLNLVFACIYIDGFLGIVALNFYFMLFCDLFYLVEDATQMMLLLLGLILTFDLSLYRSFYLHPMVEFICIFYICVKLNFYFDYDDRIFSISNLLNFFVYASEMLLSLSLCLM